jgi:hypothetical protein
MRLNSKPGTTKKKGKGGREGKKEGRERRKEGKKREGKEKEGKGRKEGRQNKFLVERRVSNPHGGSDQANGHSES